MVQLSVEWVCRAYHLNKVQSDIEEWKRRKIAAEAQRELHLADAKKQVAPLEQVETLARVFASA